MTKEEESWGVVTSLVRRWVEGRECEAVEEEEDGEQGKLTQYAEGRIEAKKLFEDSYHQNKERARIREAELIRQL